MSKIIWLIAVILIILFYTLKALGIDEFYPGRNKCFTDKEVVFHLPPLVEALKKSGNQDFSALVIPDQDHFFLEFEGKRLEKHNPGKMLIADELLETLDADLRRRHLIGNECREK